MNDPARSGLLVVFSGPSLTPAEAASRAPCRALPPARQGDVWRVLGLAPRAIALIDGFFESTPSVWHHELVAALEAGVAVFGGASMGALRAVELAPWGMVGVGTIHRWYRDGRIVDDAEVATLHAGAEHGYRPLSLPLVNVRCAAERAQAAGVLTRREARALVETAAGQFYQERTWPSVLSELGRRWRPATRARWTEWGAQRLPNLKREDAIATLEAARAFVDSGAPSAAPGRLRTGSSLVRRRRLWQGVTHGPGAPVPHELLLRVLDEDPEAGRWREAGLRRALLAAWARSLGLSASPEELAAAERQCWRGQGAQLGPRRRLLASLGLGVDEARRLFEDVALDKKVLAHAARFVADGPSPEEALASEARLNGKWLARVRVLGRIRRRR